MKCSISNLDENWIGVREGGWGKQRQEPRISSDPPLELPPKMQYKMVLNWEWSLKRDIKHIESCFVKHRISKEEVSQKGVGQERYHCTCRIAERYILPKMSLKCRTDRSVNLPSFSSEAIRWSRTSLTPSPPLAVTFSLLICALSSSATRQAINVRLPTNWIKYKWILMNRKVDHKRAANHSSMVSQPIFW